MDLSIAVKEHKKLFFYFGDLKTKSEALTGNIHVLYFLFSGGIVILKLPVLLGSSNVTY